MTLFPEPIFANIDLDILYGTSKRQLTPSDRTVSSNYVNPFRAMDKAREALEASAKKGDTEEEKLKPAPLDNGGSEPEQKGRVLVPEVSGNSVRDEVDDSFGKSSEPQTSWRYPVEEPSPAELSRIRGKGHWAFEEDALRGVTYKYWQSEEENQDKADGSFQNFDLDKFLERRSQSKGGLSPT